MVFDRKAYYERTKEKQKQTASQWKRDNADRARKTSVKSGLNARFRDPIGYLLTTTKYRASKNGIEFAITRDDIVIPDTCPILGIPLFFLESDSTKKSKNPNSPSIDRIDSMKGYVVGNIRVISWRANFLKNDATNEELIAIANFYYAGVR